MDIWIALEQLQLTPPFSSEQVSSAFRLASRKAHPDRGGSAAAFRKLTEAKNVLLDFAGKSSNLLKKNESNLKGGGPSDWSLPIPTTNFSGAFDKNDEDSTFDFLAHFSLAFDAFQKYPTYDWEPVVTRCTYKCLPFVDRIGLASICRRCKIIHACQENICGSKADCIIRSLVVGAHYSKTKNLAPPHACTIKSCVFEEVHVLRKDERRLYLCTATGTPHLCSLERCKCKINVREEQADLRKGKIIEGTRVVCAATRHHLGEFVPARRKRRKVVQ